MNRELRIFLLAVGIPSLVLAMAGARLVYVEWWQAAHPGEVMTWSALLGALWGSGYAGTNRTLDNRILSLRKKLGAAASHVETAYGVGYCYRP